MNFLPLSSLTLPFPTLSYFSLQYISLTYRFLPYLSLPYLTFSYLHLDVKESQSRVFFGRRPLTKFPTGTCSTSSRVQPSRHSTGGSATNWNARFLATMSRTPVLLEATPSSTVSKLTRYLTRQVRDSEERNHFVRHYPGRLRTIQSHA